MLLPIYRNSARRNILVTLALLCVVSFSGTARAETPALVFNSVGGTTALNQNQSIGWQFNVLAPITVTGLGWYDDGANGLTVAHEVGIWNPGGTLLASVTIPAGVTASLVGQFRTLAITPTFLAPASGYIVGGLNSSANTERVASNVAQVTIPEIGYVDATFAPVNSTFQRPTSFSSAVTGFYGPSFSVTEAAPEPGTLVLGVVGLGALLMVRRRR